ncbi:MAG TPA: hypothetical protein VMU87_19295 [Stellaceae bacterium]|nr:hypothetical protein [Stellaceae bacterium]
MSERDVVDKLAAKRASCASGNTEDCTKADSIAAALKHGRSQLTAAAERQEQINAYNAGIAAANRAAMYGAMLRATSNALCAGNRCGQDPYYTQQQQDGKELMMLQYMELQNQR